MTESWRRKKYYAPRVLLDVDRLLSPPFEDVLVCLSASQVYMVRNLMQYLHRTSTFVKEYHQGYYLCADDDDYDDIQAIVSDLEDKLMNCSDITDLLQEIADCACAAARVDWPAGGVLDGQRDYDDYISEVESGVGDPPEEFADWDEWTEYKCMAAQKIVDDLTDLGERMEVWYSTGAVITFSVFQTLVLGTSIAPPVALVIAIVGILAAAGTGLAMIAFQNWLEDNKQDLVCIIHLSDTVAAARSGILNYIDENWDLAIGKPFGEHLFSYDLLSKAYDGGLDVDGYSADYCATCSYLEGDGWFAVPVDPDTYYVHLDPGAVGGIYVPKLEGYECIGALWDCYDNDAGVDVLSGRALGSASENLWTDSHDTHGLEGDYQLSLYPAGGVTPADVLAALHPGAYLVTANTDYATTTATLAALGWKWNGGSPWTVDCRCHYLVYAGSPP
jgi:hypothetical protein